MFINNYIQNFLYIPVSLILLILLLFKSKNIFFKQFKIYYFSLFLLTLIGLSFGLIVAINSNKESNRIFDDVKKIITFVFFVGLPYYIIGINQIQFKYLYKIFNILAFTYTVLVTLSLFFAGNVDEENYSIYPGNLFGASTVNLTIISSWVFYSFFNYIISKKKIYFVWSIICYTAVLVSLSKWNTFVIIAAPILYGIIYYKSNKKLHRYKNIYIISILFFVLLYFFNLDTFLTPIAKLRGYGSFEEFTSSRVLGSTSSSNSLGQSVGVADAEIGLKDGARLAMWGDLILRTLENPIFGVGLGTRALDYMGLNVEDHNIFITHFSRYGIPIFCLWLILVLKLVRNLKNYIKLNCSIKELSNIFSVLYINFFFQASVGNTWGQMIVAILIGTSIGLMLKTTPLNLNN